MPCFNFFRVFPQQRNNLALHLSSKGLVSVEQKTVTEQRVRYRYELFFTEHPRQRPVKWITELRKQFSLSARATDSYSAVVLIGFGNTLYAITFGAAHFIVSRYADLEFGIDLAARLVSSYKIKNSRDFGGVKTKSIETYASLDDLAFEAGEAVQYIKGIPVEPDVWGRTISCGQSVQLRKRDLSMRTTHRFCERLEAALALPVIKEIPRSTHIRDGGRVHGLTQQLIGDMQSGNYMVSISQQQLSGVAFLFGDQYEYFIVANGQRLELDEHVGLAELEQLVQREFAGDYERLLAAPVEAVEDGDPVYTKQFINFIDYVDTQNNFYLEEGKWYQFDTNYLTNVRSEVDKIPVDRSREIDRFDEGTYKAWLAQQPAEGQHYRERYLNELLATNYGYVNHDRSFTIFDGAVAEITDLIRGDGIYIVKLGVPQKLNYAVDQATAAVKILERRGFQIPVGGQSVRIQKVCLWLFFERQTPMLQVSDAKSLIFLMKVAHWRKTVLMSGLQPEIRISYK